MKIDGECCGIKYKIRRENIVVKGELLDAEGRHVEIDITAVTDLFLDIAESVELGKERRFPALIIKFRHPTQKRRISVLLFSTGKIVVAGSPDIETAKYYFELIGRRLRGLGVEEAKMIPVNVVTSAELKDVRVNLERVAYNPELWYPVYEPDDFPAAIVKIPKKEITGAEGDFYKVLIYSNGKLIVPGVMDIKESEKIVRLLIEKLLKIGALIRRETI